MQPYNFPRPVYSKDLKDIPERLWPREWLRTIDFNKLPRYQLKVRMCCPKCEEMVKEEIWEARGVVDVVVFRADKKVVVTGMPEYPDTSGMGFEGRDGWLDPNQVLRRARKIDRRAKFVPLDHSIVFTPTSKIITKPPKVDLSKPTVDPPLGPHVIRPTPLSSTEFTSGPPHIFFRDPAQDDNTPFYFFLFLILLLTLLVFRK